MATKATPTALSESNQRTKRQQGMQQQVLQHVLQVMQHVLQTQRMLTQGETGAPRDQSHTTTRRQSMRPTQGWQTVTECHQ